MATMTLAVSDDLKSKMDRVNWVNWSSIARTAFIGALNDLKKLETIKKIEAISEISFDDERQVKDSFVDSTIKVVKKAETELKRGKRKLMTSADFDSWCKKL